MIPFCVFNRVRSLYRSEVGVVQEAQKLFAVAKCVHLFARLGGSLQLTHLESYPSHYIHMYCHISRSASMPSYIILDIMIIRSKPVGRERSLMVLLYI